MKKDNLLIYSDLQTRPENRLFSANHHLARKETILSEGCEENILTILPLVKCRETSISWDVHEMVLQTSVLQNANKTIHLRKLILYGPCLKSWTKESCYSPFYFYTIPMLFCENAIQFENFCSFYLQDYKNILSLQNSFRFYFNGVNLRYVYLYILWEYITLTHIILVLFKRKRSKEKIICWRFYLLIL